MTSDRQRQRQRLADEMLVLRVREGSHEALGHLVAAWQDRLWRHAWHLCHREDIAADAVQEAWMTAARRIGTLRDPASFPAWIYRIVTRRVADLTRHRPHSATSGSGSKSIDEVPDPTDRTDHDDRDAAIDALRRALDELTSHERTLISLHHLEGLGLREVAAVFEIPEGTVKSRLHQARQRLRQILERNER